MELTIEQALLLAVEAHKAANLPDAERLYRAILQTQPKHPDANHNLGVMAVSLNKTAAALPLFKTALAANPNQGQFWLSYVDALIKEKQFVNAKYLLDQGKKVGLAGEKVDLLEAQLMRIFLSTNPELFPKNSPLSTSQQIEKVSRNNEKKKHDSRSLKKPNQIKNPTYIEKNNLLKYYQQGKYDDAQNLATALTQKYPNHAFGWKVLGAVFKQIGKLQDSLVANKKVLEISPRDAAAISNLANTLKDLGRLEEADSNYKKAIAIKPDYAEAYSNWGITLHQLGRLEEAVTSYKKAIGIKPNYAEAYSNLGITLQELGRLNDAETSYKKAIAIKPEFAGAHSNLGNTLKELRRLEESVTSYKKAISINCEYPEAHSNLGITLEELGRLEDAVTSYKRAILIRSDFAEAHYNLGNALQKLGRLEEAEKSYREVIAIKPKFAETHSNLGLMLQELGRVEEAETSYRKAISIKPEYPEAHYNLGILLFEVGRYDQAIKIFGLINFKNSQSYLLRCLYLQNEKVQFYKLLDNLINQGDINPMVGSLTCRAEIKYGFIKPNLFCQEPFKYAINIDLSNHYDFFNYFIEPVRTILYQKERQDKPQKLLANGTQTLGNLFDLEPNLTTEIERIIRIEIDKYRTFFKDSEEGFLKKWPAKYTLNGWLINMKSGGKLRPHMHENGWISGSIYINVPPKSNTDSGNLVVCIDDQNYLIDGKTSHEKIIDVATGSMCLFPASLLHYTIPFESEEERIVLAFDVVPN